MAYVSRLQLKTLRHSCPFSYPALTSKLADARNIPWRCYGGSALLESCNSSAGDIDGDSRASNDAGDSAFKGNGGEDRVSTESSLDKLTSSIYDKLRAKGNAGGHDGKDLGLFEGQVGNLLTKDTKKSDKWQKVVSNARSLALKNKLKATAAGDNKLGLPLPSKMEAEDQYDLSDLDLSEAEGESAVSRQANSTTKSSSIVDAFQKGFKHMARLSPQEKPINSSFLDDDFPSLRKSLGPLLQKGFKQKAPLSPQKKPINSSNRFISVDDFLEDSIADFSLGDHTSKLKQLSNCGERDELKQLDVAQKDPINPRAVQGGGHVPVSNQSRSKHTAQGMPDFGVKGSGDDLHVRKASPSLNEATSQPLQNELSVPPHLNYMVCVHNLPSSSNPAVIKASMSIYGEVSGFYKKGRETGFSAFIQFKTEQGMDKALAARKLQIGASSFNIVRTDPVFSTVVRLAKVSVDTTETQLISVCGKFGSIDTIRKRSNGVYDVFYQVQEVSNMISILGSLNEVTLNRSTWSATPAPTLHPSVQKNVLKTPEGQAWHDMQVQQALTRIELGIDGTWVLFEDLKRLTALGKDFLKR